MYPFNRIFLQLILIACLVQKYFAQDLESFRSCIVENGLPSGLVVDQYTSNTTLYQELDFRWNSRPVHIHPLAYFVPSTTSEVSTGVKCGRATNITIVPKSGGHSAELLSSGSSSTIVISFRHMKGITIDPNEKTAVIETGGVLSEVKEYLWNNGGFGIPAGICPYVGIGGLALGGGMGFTSPLYGLTLDNILEMEMVDSEGFVHLVNNETNTDLFWGLRGSGSGLIGIVTRFKFKLFQARELKTSYVVLAYDLSNAAPVMDAFQHWLKYTIDERLPIASFLAMGYIPASTDNPFVINVIIVLQEDANTPTLPIPDFLEFVRAAYPYTDNATITFPPYIDLKVINYLEEAIDPVYEKENAFFVDQIFNVSEFETAANLIKQIGEKKMQVWAYYEGHAGVYNDPLPTDSAYVHRNSLYLLSTRVHSISMTEDEIAEAEVWYADYLDAVRFMDNGHSYQNYVDLDLVDYMTRYYGENAPRLQAIKQKWDPDNYFQNPQSIRVL